MIPKKTKCRLILSISVVSVLLSKQFRILRPLSISDDTSRFVSVKVVRAKSALSDRTTTNSEKRLRHDNNGDQNHHPLLPLISVCLPIYEGSRFLEQVLWTLYNQTYQNLEVIVSIEPSTDATISQAILKRFQVEHPEFQIQVFLQPYRIQFAGNVNFVFSKTSGEYFSYMQCDDTLPTNYYEALAHCLQSHPEAINCYPYVVAMEGEYGKLRTSNETYRCKNLDGKVHERVEKVIINNHWVPFRGLVRRSKYIDKFFLPRLPFHTDLAVLVRHAISGTMIEVDVPYYKYFHDDSLHRTMYRNTSIIPNENFVHGLIDEYRYKYNHAHSYAASSTNLLNSMSEMLAQTLKSQMGLFRGLPESTLEEYANFAVTEFRNRIRRPKRVAILGAGVQGSLAALLFRKHGYDVTLIDKSTDVMNRASIVGEARIHMGLEYANDPTFKTAAYMMESALRFASIVESLVGRKIDWSEMKSERLMNLLPHDSLVTPAQFEDYGRRLEELYERLLSEEPDLSYLGERPPKVLIGRTKIPESVNASFIHVAYESIEVCILSSKLKLMIKDALDEQGVKMVFGKVIHDVKRNNGTEDWLGRLKVITDVGENDYDAVVNCLWEDRSRIDRKMGLNVPDDESYRFKASVRLPNLQIHADIPSVSIMNGPFGDFVRYGQDAPVYFAWHPISIDMITQNQTEIQQYESHANFEFPADYAEAKIEGHRKAFETIFPHHDSSFFDSAVLGAGYVVANGLTDIDDPNSALHMRCDVPYQIVDGYISVKTQKLTTAPYNVYLLEKALFKDALITDEDERGRDPSAGFGA